MGEYGGGGLDDEKWWEKPLDKCGCCVTAHRRSFFYGTSIKKFEHPIKLQLCLSKLEIREKESLISKINDCVDLVENKSHGEWRKWVGRSSQHNCRHNSVKDVELTCQLFEL